jgi:type IV secretion system protein TrbL
MKLRINPLFKNAIWFLLLWAAFSPCTAHAAINNAGILDDVLRRYSTAASAWGSIITSHATWLFWTLTLISMVWTFGMMALRKADIGEFYAEFIRFIVFTGFFWWLLTNGPKFAIDIQDSLRKIGGNATGTGSNLTPSGIVDIGFDIFARVYDSSSGWTPVDSTAGIIISLIILVVLAFVGVNMLLLLISGWILAYAGVFFLGFGGSRWTSDMAISYFKTVLSVAAQLLTMVLLVGIGQSFVDQYYTNMSAGIQMKELGVMLIVSVILLALTNKIPPLIGQIAMGGGTGALGGGAGAAAAFGVGAASIAAVATAGAVVAAGASNMAGGAQAVMAAFSQANASVNGSEGGGLSIPDSSGNSGGAAGRGSALASAMDGDTGTSNQTNSDSLQSSNSSPSSNSSGSFATNAGKVAAGTVTNLIKGAVDVAKESAIGRINDTVGGKVAAAIETRGSTSSKGFNESNSLSAGSGNSADLQAEVAAFRDRGA